MAGLQLGKYLVDKVNRGRTAKILDRMGEVRTQGQLVPQTQSPVFFPDCRCTLLQNRVDRRQNENGSRDGVDHVGFEDRGLADLVFDDLPHLAVGLFALVGRQKVPDFQDRNKVPIGARCIH